MRGTWKTLFMIMVSSKQIFSDEGQTCLLGGNWVCFSVFILVLGSGGD